MKRPILYLMVGYPGAGKTTTSQYIQEITGATHIHADYERRAMFGDPTHSAPENKQLYDRLNDSTQLLLADGQSVIFDTNFNFRKDRDLLRAIADKYKAETRLIWIKIVKEAAKERATSPIHAIQNQYDQTMKSHEFKRITDKLEEPTADEMPILLDGTQITREYVAKSLHLPLPVKHRIAKAFNSIKRKPRRPANTKL